MLLNICIFAHNVSTEIAQCINSLVRQMDSFDYTVYVIVNGCSDNTFQVVQEISQDNGKVIPVAVDIGDKANAWNIFIYQYYDRNSIPIFIDGDVTISGDAVKNIIKYHLDNEKYNSVSSFPWHGGRSSYQWRNDLKKHHQFTGNLYLLSTVFANKIIDKKVKLPVGLIGDDSMLGYLSATDLCSDTDDPYNRIGVCENAIFFYPRLSMLKLKDIKLYYRRRKRYALRRFQQNAIIPMLKKEGCSAMPQNGYDVFKLEGMMPTIKWRGLDTYFDFLALRDIKKKVAM